MKAKLKAGLIFLLCAALVAAGFFLPQWVFEEAERRADFFVAELSEEKEISPVSTIADAVLLYSEPDTVSYSLDESGTGRSATEVLRQAAGYFSYYFAALPLSEIDFSSTENEASPALLLSQNLGANSVYWTCSFMLEKEEYAALTLTMEEITGKITGLSCYSSDLRTLFESCGLDFESVVDELGAAFTEHYDHQLVYGGASLWESEETKRATAYFTESDGQEITVQAEMEENLLVWNVLPTSYASALTESYDADE